MACELYLIKAVIKTTTKAIYQHSTAVQGGKRSNELLQGRERSGPPLGCLETALSKWTFPQFHPPCIHYVSACLACIMFQALGTKEDQDETSAFD